MGDVAVFINMPKDVGFTFTETMHGLARSFSTMSATSAFIESHASDADIGRLNDGTRAIKVISDVDTDIVEEVLSAIRTIALGVRLRLPDCIFEIFTWNAKTELQRIEVVGKPAYLRTSVTFPGVRKALIECADTM